MLANGGNLHNAPGIVMHGSPCGLVQPRHALHTMCASLAAAELQVCVCMYAHTWRGGAGSSDCLAGEGVAGALMAVLWVRGEVGQTKQSRESQ